jgi:hypothetical protein
MLGRTVLPGAPLGREAKRQGIQFLRFSESFRISQIVLALICFETGSGAGACNMINDLQSRYVHVEAASNCMLTFTATQDGCIYHP